MPTYEYVCRECGEHLEVVQSFKDGPLTTCGLCGGELRKVFSAAGIIFKGSGYYVTDTRAKQGAAGEKGTDGAAASDGKTADAKADSAGTAKSDGAASSASDAKAESA